MEHLTYSLWFIAVWAMLIFKITIDMAKKKRHISVKGVLFVTSFPSAIAILLEYLIVKG